MTTPEENEVPVDDEAPSNEVVVDESADEAPNAEHPE